MFDDSSKSMPLFWSSIVGLIVTGALIWVTEYYTSTEYRPVQSIAKSSETGHGTNVIQGLAISMEATAVPAIIIALGIVFSYNLAGIYGIALAATTMYMPRRSRLSPLPLGRADVSPHGQAS